MDLISLAQQHWSEILSAILGAVFGYTFRFTQDKSRTKVVQRDNTVGGDQAGRDIKKR